MAGIWRVSMVSVVAAACGDNLPPDVMEKLHSAAPTSYGTGLAVSGDGQTLAIGASLEDGHGVLHVYARTADGWAPQAALVGANTDPDDEFGGAAALSNDGNVLAVSACGEQSAGTGVDGDASDNSLFRAGAVYIFTRAGSAWTQQAYIKASNTEDHDTFCGPALSADGMTLAVGAYFEDSAAIGVDGDQTDNNASRSGAVYVFSRSGSTWTQQAYIKAFDTRADDVFGIAALSANGNLLAVGAYDAGEDVTGAVYTYVRANGQWTTDSRIVASNGERGDHFGNHVALSADGQTLAVTAHNEASATGTNPADNSAPGSGAAYVFKHSVAGWTQDAYVKAQNAGAADQFGFALALSADGNDLVVGAHNEASGATGMDGNELDESAKASGAVYVFHRETSWAPTHYLKADEPVYGQRFGWETAIGGPTLAVSAINDDSVYLIDTRVLAP